jgi:hypothetical protein
MGEHQTTVTRRPAVLLFPDAKTGDKGTHL